MGAADDEDGWVVDFPTLGDIADAWVRQHCRQPDRLTRGGEFRWSDWQFWCAANYYRVRPGVEWPSADEPLLNQAFTYRRAQIVGPQKALAVDTPIATPSGWSTMGELQPGDLVFDERGEPTAVLSKSQVWHTDTYRVTFSDGASLVACKDHQWWVERRRPSATYVSDRVRTEDLVGNLQDQRGARRFRVPNARPLRLPDADLPIDPYTLGAWLGDGNSDDGRLTGLDREVFDRVALAGYEVRQMKVAKRVNVIGLKAQLRTLGVLGNKHIPAAYLRGSEKQRWALLQGLMDTDGYCDERQGKCEFTTILPALRDGMLELLASLGVRPRCYSGQAKLYGRATGPKYRISFSARSDMPVFGLERKQSRLRPPGRGHAQFEHRRIVSVERIETVPTQCLTVAAESHVFLAGREMIPTCNTGKGPWAASMTCVEAVGPSQFLGWAGKGDGWACSDWGCGCGWEYEYLPGEPMGMRHPSPVIQLTANNEDQVGNVYRPLTAMIRLGPLSDVMMVREGFIRILGGAGGEDFDRVDAVTSSARGRVGNPISWALQDETGLYTVQNKMVGIAETQRRGAAGMGGRTCETTNAWDPAEDSAAQRTYESNARDIWKFFRIPPASLSWNNKRERRKILRYVYRGSPWVNLDSIEAEAVELAERDPAQAERFFGNRLVARAGTWLPAGLWESRYAETAALAS
ncbi:LAGLIDADG family homing endonuclease [Nocardia wallacei]|uniref:LAGLIDADG family homing endonuclease n=1 Tax=Nocardia wallacei TaxID=480035 RepID=UPI0024551FD5|nr:LAGLIDADG family homing endonuclease [Nocardia wallacei]